jgi:hypothetical protein
MGYEWNREVQVKGGVISSQVTFKSALPVTTVDL